jgi:hypothetical protein
MNRRIYAYGMPENVRYTLVRGHLREWLREHSIPAMWSPARKGWLIRTDRLGDVLALAELDGYDVRLKGSVTL